MRNEETVSIGEAAKQCKMSVRRVRYICDQGYISPPVTNKCGEIVYRFFTENHIQQIKLIKAYQDEGFTLKMAAAKTKEVMENGVEKKETN